MNKENIKKYVINIIILLLMVVIFSYCIFYIIYNNKDEKNIEDNPIQLITESNQVVAEDKYCEKNAKFETGYYNIYLQPNDEKIHLNNGIKLYVHEENGYFFLPSYSKNTDLVIDYDEQKYQIEVNGCSLHSGDVLRKYANDEAELKILVSDGNTVVEHKISLNIMYSQNLPAIFIETANDTMEYINAQKDNEEPGHMICVEKDGVITGNAHIDKIKMHGNTSLYSRNDKKSYQVNFENAINLLDMGVAHKWILQSNMYDKTYMRNKLVYDIAIGLKQPYAIESQYADVYFNNEYAGNYLICEKIEIGKNRIDIADLGIKNKAANGDFAELSPIVETQNVRYYDMEIEPDDISGGYLLEVNNILVESDERRIEKTDCFFDTGKNIYEVKSPKQVSKAEMEYISFFISDIENKIAECDTTKEFNELKKLIDIDSFVNMYIIDAVTNEVDANSYSTFFYKMPEKLGDKLFAGPVWDYDRAFGNEERNIYFELNGFRNGLSEVLFENKLFKEEVVNKFNNSQKYISDKAFNQSVDILKQHISKSVEMDEIRWYNDKEKLNYSYDCFDDEVDYLKYYYTNRFQVVNGYLNKPDNYSCISFVNDDGQISECWIENGNLISAEIMKIMKTQYSCDFWMQNNGSRYQQGRPVFGNMALNAGRNSTNQSNSIEKQQQNVNKYVSEEGENAMNWLAFILLMTPGLIPLAVSGKNKADNFSSFIKLIINYMINSFIIVFVVYGVLYFIKGSILFSFSNDYDENYYYTIFHTNAVFVYALLSGVCGLILGIIERFTNRRS